MLSRFPDLREVEDTLATAGRGADEDGLANEVGAIHEEPHGDTPAAAQTRAAQRWIRRAIVATR